MHLFYDGSLPWHLGQRWGLRAPAAMLAQESPFNLAQTTTDSVAALLEDGLDRLISPDLLSLATASDGTSRPLNLSYQFDFNHERGALFTGDGYAGLIARYARRLSSFGRWLAGAPCVLLHYTERNGDLGRLARAVAAASPHGNYILVILDVWSGPRATLLEHPRVRHIRMDLPWPDYQWFRPDHWDDQRGIAFERSLQRAVLAAASQLAGQLPPYPAVA